MSEADKVETNGDAWRGARPGLESPASGAYPFLCPALLASAHDVPGPSPWTVQGSSSVSLQPLQAGDTQDGASVIFPSSVPKRGSDPVSLESDPMCKLLNNLLRPLTPFLQRVHIQDLCLGHDPFNEIKDRRKTETTGCSGGRVFGFNVCSLFPGSLRWILWF